MKAVILAGGLGSRLAEETDLKPTPMMESMVTFPLSQTNSHFDREGMNL